MSCGLIDLQRSYSPTPPEIPVLMENTSIAPHAKEREHIVNSGYALLLCTFFDPIINYQTFGALFPRRNDVPLLDTPARRVFHVLNTATQSVLVPNQYTSPSCHLPIIHLSTTGILVSPPAKITPSHCLRPLSAVAYSPQMINRRYCCKDS